MDSETEEERKPSDIKIFVDNCDSYVGSAVSSFLAKEGYHVLGYGTTTPCPGITLLPSRKEGILSSEISVFEMLEDTSAVEEALHIVGSNPLHHKVKMAIFTPLLTWGGRQLHPPEEAQPDEAKTDEEKKDEPKPEETKADEPKAEEPKTEEPHPEEEETPTEPETPVNEEEYLQRTPLDIVKKQYRLESRALQLNSENDRLTIFLLATGLLYGRGENVLYPFFRSLWEFKADAFPASKAHISCLHVNNLGLAVKQLLSLDQEETKRYFILSEPSCPSLREIAKAFSKVLSDGKVTELGDLNPLHKALLTTELASESTLFSDAELFCAEGIVECAAKVVDEFRAKYHLEPLKVLVAGPPYSGFKDIGGKVAAKLGTPLIDPYELADEAKKEAGEFGDEVRASLEENEGNISDEIICKVAHRRMLMRDCRNKGWVISGFADSYEKAGLLFNAEDEEEPASPHFAPIPTHVVVLEASDDILRRKAAENGNDSEAFEKALKKFRNADKGENPDEESHDLFSFFDDRAIPSLIVDAFAEIENLIWSFVGEKRDFGRPIEEIEAEKKEVKRVEEEKAAKEQKKAEEQLAEEVKTWDQGDGIHDCSVARLESEDEEFLAGKSKMLEEYLDSAVLKDVIDGLVEVGKTMPDDPIDKLAAFLFARHRANKKQTHK